MNNSKVTIKDVAREAGVSIATVSYVINNIDKVTDKTRKKVLRTIEKLGYSPNLAARSLVKQESRQIGIIVPIRQNEKQTVLLDNPFYLEFFSSVENMIRINGYSTIIISVEEERELIKHLNNGNLAGIIVLGAVNDFIYKVLEAVSIPVVVIDQDKISDRFFYIGTDNALGAFLAVEHLVKNGHKNIALLSGGPMNSLVTKKRIEGYKEALRKYNIEENIDNIIEADVSYEGGIAAAEIVLKKYPRVTGVFAISDIMALGFIKGLYKHGIIVPQNMSVIGFDNIKNSRYFIPELTTINQNIGLKAEKAVETIMNVLGDKGELTCKELTLPTEIIERESIRNLNIR